MKFVFWSHGNATLQDRWASSELGGFMHARKERAVAGIPEQNQGCGEDCALGPLYNTGRHLKFSGDEAIRDLKWVVAQPEKMEVGEMSSSGPWWWSFDAALEMVKW